jgi:RNA polymerase sigma-B factor
MTVTGDHRFERGSERARTATTVEQLLAARHTAGPAQAAEIEARCVHLQMAFAQRIAAQYFGRGVPADDLEQVAYMALVKAIRRFDPSRGDRFASFAIVTIRGDLRRYFRDSGWMVRPPRSVQELQARLWSARDDLTETLHRPPTLDELSDATDVDVRRVGEALSVHSCFSATPLDGTGPGDESLPLADRVGTDDEGYERVETAVVLRDALATLSARDRYIVRLRFFDGLSQKEIGDRIGVTQMQVSRLLTRILRDLRSVITREVAA